MVGIRFHINALGAFLKIKRLKVNQMQNMQQCHQLTQEKARTNAKQPIQKHHNYT